jgi:hypothetical protein
MKPFKWIAASALALALLVTSCKPSGSIGLGPRLGGHELAVLLKRHPDFSGTGPVVDEDYRLIKAEWVKSNLNVASFGDCDDYAAKAFVQAQSHGRRVAFGMAIATQLTGDNKLGGHAFNFFITPEKEIYFYEGCGNQPLRRCGMSPASGYSMAREKTNKTATYVFIGFGAAAALALILWVVGVFKTPDKDTPTPGSEKPLGGSASEVLYGK